MRHFFDTFQKRKKKFLSTLFKKIEAFFRTHDSWLVFQTEFYLQETFVQCILSHNVNKLNLEWWFDSSIKTIYANDPISPLKTVTTSKVKKYN